MAVSIRTNLAALKAAKYINENSTALASTSAQLASGLRINDASDDPAGLAISSIMSSKIGGMTQAQNNIGQAISMAQTIDGALSQQNSILQRLATLANESANGSLTDAQRVATIQPEVDALIAEFDKIGNSAAFNGLGLLAGGSTGVTATSTAGTLATGAAVSFQSNLISHGDTVTISETAAGLMTMTWTTAGGLETQATADANISVVASTGTTSAQTINFIDASGASIATATVASGATAVVTVSSGSPVSLTLTTGTSNAFVMQVGTENNSNSQLTMTIPESLSADYSVNSLSMKTQAAARTAISTITAAISNLGTARAKVGGVISQLNHAADFITDTLINTQGAHGAITDVDVATAAANLAEQNVLVQAATAMLSQANQSPTVILGLLRNQ